MNRNKLPDRRRGYTQKMIVGKVTIYLRTGEYPDGTLGEIFVSVVKEGELLSALMNSFCIAVSIALQSGASLDDLVKNFVFSKFEPAGMVRNHEHIKSATSILDAIFRDLAISYLGRDDLRHT